ncbi:MAG: DoxX family membrane protein [Acidobacteriia bacterium]|nr:DoxX family membrane protein [Terriglobia bacterium]
MATTAISAETSARPAAWPRVLLLIGRVALGLVFVVAAYTKLHFNGAWHFSDYYFFFGMAINSYNLLPFWAVELMGRILPWFEVALGFFLISGVALRWVGIVASLLLLAFIGGMVHAYILGLEIVCGCFGNSEKLGPLTLLRDGSLLVLALAVTIGAFLVKKREKRVRAVLSAREETVSS